jgi:DNA-binding CsgD family transcriptional regulator
MEAVVPHGCPLTSRQFQVLTLLCDGKTYKQAARELGVSLSTVRTHAHGIIRRLDVHDIKSAIAAMGRRGWWGWVPPVMGAPPPPPEPPPAELDVQCGPWATAVLCEFDKWLASRWSDQAARDGMRLATRGACNAVGTEPGSSGRAPQSSDLRTLLHMLAAETLTPTE